MRFQALCSFGESQWLDTLGEAKYLSISQLQNIELSMVIRQRNSRKKE